MIEKHEHYFTRTMFLTVFSCYVIFMSCLMTTTVANPVLQNEQKLSTIEELLTSTENPAATDVDNENSRKVLGSSVVTSVSVIMETNNGSHKYYADAAGRPVARPTTASQLASPVTLINPDRYEFYTFNDDGDLIKREMTLKEIQKIIAAGGSEDDVTNLNSFRPEEYQIKNAETRVHDVVANVQSVLKEEIAAHKNNQINNSDKIQLPDLSELSASWTMFGNGDDAQDIAIIPDIEMMDQTPDGAPIIGANMNLTGFLSTVSKIPTSTEAQKESTTVTEPPSTSMPEIVQDNITTNKPSATVKENTTQNESSSTSKPEIVEENTSEPPQTSKSDPIMENVSTTTEEQPENIKFNTQDESSSIPNEIQPVTEEVTKTLIVINDKLDDLSTELKSEIVSSTLPPKLVTWFPDLSSSSTTTERLTTLQEIIITSTTPEPSINEISANTTLSDELEILNTKFVQIASSNDDKTVEETITSTTEDIPLKSTTIIIAQDTESTTEFISPKESTTAQIPEEVSTIEDVPNSTPIVIVSDKNNLKSTLIEDVDQIIAQVTETSTQSNEIHNVAESMLNIINTTNLENNITLEELQAQSATIASSLTDQVAITSTETSEEASSTTENNPEVETTTILIEQLTENYLADSTNQDSETILPKESQEVIFTDSTTTEEISPESTTKLEMSIVSETSSTSVKMGDTDEISTVTEEISTESDEATTEIYKNDIENALKTKYEEIELKDDASITTTEINEIIPEESKTTEYVETAPTTTEAVSTTLSISNTDNSKEEDSSSQENTTTESFEESVDSSTSSSEENLPTSTTSSEESFESSTSSSESDEYEISSTTIENAPLKSTTLQSAEDEEISEIAENSNIQSYTTEDNTLTAENTDFESTTEDILAKLPIKNTSNIALRLDETATSKIFPIIKEIFTTEFPEKFTTIQFVETTPKPSPKPAKLDLELEKQMLEAEEKILASTTTISSEDEKLSTTENILTTQNIETTVKNIPDSPEIAFSKPIPQKVLVPENLNIESTTINIPKELTTAFENPELADDPSTITDKQLPTTIQLPESTTKNAWKLVPIISPVTEKNKTKKPKPDIKPLKSGIFNFQRPNIYRPISASASTYSSNINLNPTPAENLGLEATTVNLSEDINQFTQLCNELAFKIWSTVTSKGISTVRSVFISPFAVTSMLAMVFLGARGPTSGEMNDILKLDDMVTFNPHLVFRNVTESIQLSKYSGVAKSVIIRELFSDRTKGKLLDFYKERARQFYDGHVEEANYKIIGNLVKHRTNLLVRRQTNDKIMDYIKGNLIVLRPPLAALTANIFQTDCTLGSTEGRDGELHFIVSPTIRQRRLVPVPAVVYRSGFLAGYDPELDATAIAIGNDQVVSMIYVVPGQQGNAAPGDGLSRLEKHLTEMSFKTSAWSKLLRTLSQRPGLEVQIPRFSHRSVINATQALQKMGLRELFNPTKADLRGLNGNKNELHLSDMIQVNNFTTCGENIISERTHHIEVYPAVPIRLSKSDEDDIQEDEDFNEDGIRDSKYLEYADEPRDYQRAFHDPVHDPSIMDLPLALRPRQARIPDTPRLRLDRPFLYFVRHNPTGLILHMGRFNPRLLP